MNRYRLVAAEATMNVTTAADAAQCLTMVAAATPAGTTETAVVVIPAVVPEIRARSMMRQTLSAF